MGSCSSFSSSTHFAQYLIYFSSYPSQNAGQNCIGIERLIVHSSQYDDLREILEKRVDKLRLGSVMAPTDEGYISPVDCGSMISKDRFAALQARIRAAKEAGANVQGGVEYHHVYANGAYFRPAIVGPVTSDMEIAQEERMCSSSVIRFIY